MSDDNAGVIHILRRTRPWVSFLSVFGLVVALLITLFGLASWAGIGQERAGHGLPLAMLVVYPLMVIAWLVPSLRLHKYARRIGTFVAQGHQAQLEAALEAERRFWMFIGILAVLTAILAVVTVAGGMLLGFMASP
ncbi:MAG: hypothetical protein ND807_02055 [Vicinamibacterales bacterium]|nr:hypothetical protein [Vicinamibacterales bacterium]